MSESEHFRVRVHDNSATTAYFELPDHPRITGEESRGCVGKSVMLHQLIKDYDGPSLILDFGHDGRPIGIEVLYPLGDEEE